MYHRSSVHQLKLDEAPEHPKRTGQEVQTPKQILADPERLKGLTSYIPTQLFDVIEVIAVIFLCKRILYSVCIFLQKTADERRALLCVKL